MQGGGGSDDDGHDKAPEATEPTKTKTKPKPKGRRRVEDLTDLPIEVIVLEGDGGAPEGSRLIGYEESWKLAWRAASPRHFAAVCALGCHLEVD